MRVNVAINAELVDISHLDEVMGQFLTGVRMGLFAAGVRKGYVQLGGSELEYTFEELPPIVAEAACEVDSQ